MVRFPAGLVAWAQGGKKHAQNALRDCLVRCPALLPGLRRAPRRQPIPRLSLVYSFFSAFALQ